MPQLHPPPLLPQPMEAMPGALLGGPPEKPLVPDELQMVGRALPPGLDGAPKLQAQLPPDQEDPIGPRAAGLLTGRLRGGLLAAAVGDRQRSSVAGEWGGCGGRGYTQRPWPKVCVRRTRCRLCYVRANGGDSSEVEL